ncbi:MAG: Gfo/Idh/MocA family oxidoreductase [Acidobacteriaceae bacterium]
MALSPGSILNVAVVGAGAFGRNHLRIYRDLEAFGAPIHLAAVVDADTAVLAGLREHHPRAAFFSSIDHCLDAHARGELSLHAASICVPTSAHHAAASAALRGGIDVLVEKPIAADLAQADDLLRIAQESGRVLQVGHLERFNPAVLAAARHIHRPMFFEAHRLSVFTPRSLDVDVVLDLMIHDLDVVLSFVDSPVRELHAVGLPILSRKVDIANVRVEFESGCVANFTASRVSTERVRKLRFFQPHQYVSIDYARQDLLFIDVAPRGQTKRETRGETKRETRSDTRSGGIDDGPSPASSGGELALAKPAVAPGEPLRLEIEAFLRCVRDRSQPMVSGADGRAALALALDINRAIATHASRAGLDRF